MAEIIPIPNTPHMVCPEKRKLILNIADQAQYIKIREAIPVEVEREIEGKHLLMVPLHEDTSRILFNLGVHTRGLNPLSYTYNPIKVEGKYEAMPHQIESAGFLATHNRAYNLSSMRVGKTSSQIMCMDYLLDIKGIEGSTLIVAPLSTLSVVWESALKSSLPYHKIVVLHGGIGKKSRLEKLKQPADVYIINPDGLKMIENELAAAVETRRISKVVFDEMTIFSNPGSGRWKAANNIVNGKIPCKYVHGLSGSAGANVIAVFGMAKLINSAALPCDRLTTWSDLVTQRWGSQIWQIKERPEAQLIIRKTLQPAIRFSKEDVLKDLPPVVTQGREAELTPEQGKFCTSIIKEMVAMVADKKIVEAVNKAAAIGKYFQGAQGSVIVDDGIMHLDDKPRIETIKEIISETTAKVVIFCAYVGVINKRVDQLRKLGFTVEKVDGSVTGKKRDQIFGDFQEKDNPRILVAHPETCAYGVELSRADTMIFDGPPRSGTFLTCQALERLSSLKQKADQITIIQLSATDEERAAFSDIDQGISSSESVNKLFTDMTKYGRGSH